MCLCTTLAEFSTLDATICTHESYLIMQTQDLLQSIIRNHSHHHSKLSHFCSDVNGSLQTKE